MNIVSEIVENNSGLLTSLLIYKEFRFDQASAFLPHAVRSIVAVVMEQADNDRFVSERSCAIATLMQQIDIPKLAADVAIDVERASTGVAALLPKVLEIMVCGENGVTAVQGDRVVMFCTTMAKGSFGVRQTAINPES